MLRPRLCRSLIKPYFHVESYAFSRTKKIAVKDSFFLIIVFLMKESGRTRWLLSLVGDENQKSVASQAESIAEWVLKKESYLWHIGAFHCAHMGKFILWITIGCWSMCGHISIYIPAFTLEVLQGFYCYSLANWAETHFSQPCSLMHRSGWVCLGFGGSWSKPSDMDSGKLAFTP